MKKYEINKTGLQIMHKKPNKMQKESIKPKTVKCIHTEYPLFFLCFCDRASLIQ